MTIVALTFPCLNLRNRSKEVRIVRPEKGRFVLVDGIGKEHKSFRLGDALSMEPSKLP